MSSDSDEEDFVEYGSSLDPLDEDSLPRKKSARDQDQVATDSHGRRRFHGAFTGGFSAGFFNSVGSLEGWTPSSFKSSRSDKTKIAKQKPEDFMDEEDMDEHGIAPRVLRATSDFNDQSLKRKKMPYLSDEPIPGEPVMRDLLQPARETVGLKLLMKMGWKPGQGIGPRVTKKEKRKMKETYQKTRSKVYGCSLPQTEEKEKQSDSDSDISTDDEAYENVTFAPEDYQPTACKPSDNSFGLGYSGLDRRPVLSGHVNLFEPSPLRMEEKKKKVLIAGQAFGVGAFENEDEDIYSKEDMSQYDFSLDNVPCTTQQNTEKSSLNTLTNYIGDLLEGFNIGKSSGRSKKSFPPPKLPPNFQPIHRQAMSRFEPKVNNGTSLGNNKEQQKTFTAMERAQALDESPSKPTGLHFEKTTTRAEITEGAEMSEMREKPSVSAGFGPSVFRPFAADPEKERRYDKFLELSKKGEKDRMSYFQPITMTEWEKERERVEFEQAARLYQPLSGLMKDRFVPASQNEDLNNILEPLSKPEDPDSDKRAAAKIKMFGRLTREETEWRPCSLLCKRFNVPELYPGSGESSNAAPRKPKFSVFDFLDAATSNRNQSPSDNGSTSQSEPFLGVQNVSDSTIIEKEQEDNIEDQETKMSPTAALNEQKTDVEDLGFPDPPAKVDLFKAIFLCSSEDSDSENEEESEVKAESTDMPTVVDSSNFNIQEEHTLLPGIIEPAVKNLQRNTSPPRGVFANLDLDAINARRKEKSKETPTVTTQASHSDSSKNNNEDLDAINARTKEKSKETPSATTQATDSDNSKNNSERITSEENVEKLESSNSGLYGPQLPSVLAMNTKHSTPVTTVLPSIVPSCCCHWVEKSKKSKHKEKHKKQKKSKHKKSKSKHKKKKH